MKKIKNLFVMLGVFLLFSITSLASASLSPFTGVKATGDMASITAKVKGNIATNHFTIVGEYNVAKNKNLKVIAFTRNDLKKVTSTYHDRGAMASVLKVGIRKTNSGIEVSLLNPNYTFNAYFGSHYDKNSKVLGKINHDALAILNGFGKPKTFGGSVSITKLRKYHYMMGMPYFTDPITLQKYHSFNAGLTSIAKNLQNNKHVKLVYKMVDKKTNTAVFGFELLGAKGEKAFMPTIGERNFTAMPYEIILQGNKVTMLHGRYRIALYWPELSMGTFSKIMSTPGNIENAMRSVVK